MADERTGVARDLEIVMPVWEADRTAGASPVDVILPQVGL